MNKGILIIIIGVAVLALVLSGYFIHLDDDSANNGFFNPGDTVSMRVPATGTIYRLIVEPLYVRYHLKNPEGKTAYTEDHSITYKKDEILGWSFYDEHQIMIGAFPMDGTWMLEGEVHSQLGPIDLGSATPEKKSFCVVDNFLCSLFAPLYLYIGGVVPFSAPILNIALFPPIYLLLIVVVAITLLMSSRYMQNTRTKRMIEEYSKKNKG